MLKVKFKVNINGVIKVNDYVNINICVVWETLNTQGKEFREDELISTNDESGCDKKDEDVQGSDAGKKLLGISLAVQWLRLHTSNAGGVGSIPGQGSNIPHATVWQKNKKLRGNKNGQILRNKNSIQELLEDISYHWKCEGQVEVDSDLQLSLFVEIRKNAHTIIYVIWQEKEKYCSQITFAKFSQRNKTLVLNVFDVLNYRILNQYYYFFISQYI